MELKKLSQHITIYFLTEFDADITLSLWILFLYVQIRNELQQRIASFSQRNIS